MHNKFYSLERVLAHAGAPRAGVGNPADEGAIVQYSF